MELGPCNIAGPNSTSYNPYGWNSHANLLVVDQPVDVGWSYADYGERVSTTEEAAVDMAAFLTIFMSEIAGMKGKALHLSGESFAVSRFYSQALSPSFMRMTGTVHPAVRSRDT